MLNEENSLGQMANKDLSKKAVFLCVGILIIKIRRSWDRLIFIMGITTLLRHFYIEPTLTKLSDQTWRELQNTR